MPGARPVVFIQLPMAQVEMIRRLSPIDLGSYSFKFPDDGRSPVSESGDVLRSVTARAAVDIVTEHSFGRGAGADGTSASPNAIAKPREEFPQAGQLYVFERGCLYLSERPVSDARRRRAATIVLSMADRKNPSSSREYLTYGAVAKTVKPLTRHQSAGVAGTQCAILLFPTHPGFRRFCANPVENDGQDLDAAAYTRFGEALRLARCGELGIGDAQRLFDDIVAAVEQELPCATELDPRAARALELLANDPSCSLESLAQTMHLSYHRMSHLFAASLGVSFRSCQSALRIHRGLSLFARGLRPQRVAEEAGFYDVRHLNRVCYEELGIPPSFFSRGRVRIHG